MIKRCNKCKVDYDYDSNFCSACGNELKIILCKHYSLHTCRKGLYQCNGCYKYFTIKPYSTKLRMKELYKK